MPRIKHTPGPITAATAATIEERPMTAPEPWKIRLAVAFCLLIVAWPTAEAACAGKPLHTAAGVLGLAAVALLGALVCFPDLAGQPVVTADDAGVTVAATRTQRRLLLIGKLCAALALVVVGYLQFSGRISWIPTDGHYGRRGRAAAALMPVLLPVLGALSLPWTALILHQFLELDEPEFIRLTRDGVTMSYSEHRQRTLRWDEIADIPGGFTTYSGRFVPKVRIAPTTGRAFDAPTVVVQDHCGPVNALLRFHWQHPQHRGELGGGAALIRYTRCDFAAAGR
jgi:hypothetical protein